MLTIENVIKNPAAFRLSNADVHLHEGASKDDLPHVTPEINIVQDDQDIYVHFVWTQHGFLTKLLSSACGWECRVYLELMGQGEAANPPASVVPFVPGEGRSYSTFLLLRGLPEGVYRVVATLLFRGPGSSPTPIASYEDLGILQVYRDA